MDYVSKETLARFGLIEQEDGIYVVNAEGVDAFDAEKLEKKFLEIGILEAPYDNIIKLYNQDLKKPVKVADEFGVYDKIKNDYVRVMVSKDGLEAYLDVTFPSTDLIVSIRDILHKIYSQGIVYNIDLEKLNQIVRNKIFVEKEVVARGEESIIGEEAQIVIEVDTEVSSEPLIKDDGSVDFHQVSMLKTVEKEQLLAVKIPATKGQDGMDVLGNVIDSTGPDLKLPQGKNTYISDDGLSLYAAVSGRIVNEKHVLSIENILAIHGDVDFSTGNIEFTGDIAISGDVLTGFKVKTEGDIRIRGVVEGAEIISTEGNVIIGRGIVGQEKAKILAAKDVKAEFINEATVEAGNDVIVGEYIMNTTISAENEIRATEGRGSIMGGKAYAEKAIEAKTIGSANYMKTEVKVGGRVESELYEKMLIIERDEEYLEKASKSLLKEVEFIEVLKKKLPKFPEKKQKELKDLLIKLKKVEAKKGEVKKKKEELSKEYNITVSESEKKISANTLFRNTLFSIDQNKLLAEYTYKSVLITSKEGDMKINYQSRLA
ncbi:MAG: DUF342 domain-containing protein [bacterium]|nr:DUF342 domain-containing protein [bacterium]